MSFAYTEYWWWFLLLPLMGFGYFLLQKRSLKIFPQLFDIQEISAYFPKLKFVLRVSALVFLLLALLGPYWGNEEHEVEVKSREIYFLLDVSASMNANDLKPTRLEKIKHELKNVIAKLKGDRMGLIVFTSHAYPQCPLTTDYKALSMYLDLVATNEFANTGTDFRAPLLLAFQRLTKQKKKQTSTGKAIVLISDGENFGEKYGSVTKRLKKANIPVFTVGIGTKGGSKVPVYNQNGQIISYMKNESGEEVVSRLDEETLVDIADEFGTEYFQIQSNYDNLDGLVGELQNLSASKIDNNQEVVLNNRYQYFLAISLIAFVASIFLVPIKKEVE